MANKVFNTQEFSTQIISFEEGITVEVWVRHGFLIKSDTYYKSDYFGDTSEEEA